ARTPQNAARELVDPSTTAASSKPPATGCWWNFLEKRSPSHGGPRVRTLLPPAEVQCKPEDDSHIPVAAWVDQHHPPIHVMRPVLTQGPAADGPGAGGGITE